MVKSNDILCILSSISTIPTTINLECYFRSRVSPDGDRDSLMADSASTATSLEDRTEDLDTGIEENPTRDTLAEGLLCLVRPTIDSLEQQVSSTLTAQV